MGLQIDRHNRGLVKTLPGQEVKASDYAELLKAVDKLLWEIVYKPVVDLVRPSLPRVLRSEVSARELRESTPKELHNAGDDALRKALREGRVQMIADHTGKNALFSVAKPDRMISDGLRAFGATINKQTGLWSCKPSQVPAWVRLEAQGYATKARGAHDAVKNLIDDLGGKIDELVDNANLSKAADHAITEVAGGWKEGAKKLEVIPDLGPAGQSALVAGFARTREIPIKSPGTKVGMVAALDESTKKYVKVWAQEALTRLRDQVDENAIQGYRAEGLAERVRNEYGVSKGRAELIARQETNNFMAAYRAARAADAGLKRYVWTSVRDARTRKLHKEHDGQIYYYAQPPIIDERTGQRGNPGETFRCRCVDRPVIE